MKYLEFTTIRSFRVKNWLMSIISVVLTPSYFLVTCTEVFAGNLPNSAAIVDSVSNRGVSLNKKPLSSTVRNQPVQKRPRLWGNGESQAIVEKNASAGFGFTAIVNGKVTRQGRENHYFTQPRQKSAVYTYSCATRGTFVVGWSKGFQSKGCDAVKIASGQQSKKKNLLKADATEESDKSFQYCSAVAESDVGEPVSGWGAVVTNAPWDLLSSNDPCKEAVRRCEKVKSGNSTCVAVNMGEQDIKELEEEFTAVLKCGIEDRDIHRELKIPADLDQWLKQQANNTLKSSSCTLHVLSSDELLVFPTTPDTTLIATGDEIEPFDEPVVVVLAGKVKVVSPDLERQPTEIAAGNACYPDGTFSLQPSTRIPTNPVQSPVAPEQQQQFPSQNGTPTCASSSSDLDYTPQLNPITRQEVIQDNAVVKDFFLVASTNDPEAIGWSPEFADSIEGYKEATIKGFGTYDGEVIEGFENLFSSVLKTRQP